MEIEYTKELKVGSKVKIKKLKHGRKYGNVFVNGEMARQSGKIFTIRRIVERDSDNIKIYTLEEFKWQWSKEMFDVV